VPLALNFIRKDLEISEVVEDSISDPDFTAYEVYSETKLKGWRQKKCLR